jgi:hypothetical protein
MTHSPPRIWPIPPGPSQATGIWGTPRRVGKSGIPESMVAEEAARKQAESGEAVFVPISLKASPVEIELPNGGVVRLPLGIGQVVLVEVIRAVGALRPWKAPKS